MHNGIERTIRDRRTIRSFADKEVTEDMLLRLLNAAVWAPFHSRVEPWRFIVFMKDGRKAFADAVLSTYTKEELERYGAGARYEYEQETPVHIVIVVPEDEHPGKMEDALLAAASLIQNMQLLAWEWEMGFVWKTHEYNREDAFKERTGIMPNEKIVGTLHLGYIKAEKIPKAKPRKPAEQLVTWHKG
ncbi:nitroreductase family protein [Paenibacillus sinopodophylli]|uniref:nitroreductase family protein n=1 Tax=Paenibacillus sinopodophylli TaxID=1837342 RepID=UPI00110CC8E2|nr:nitroreductase family protein [Paenibacillus sinopodophylli]